MTAKDRTLFIELDGLPVTPPLYRLVYRSSTTEVFSDYRFAVILKDLLQIGERRFKRAITNLKKNFRTSLANIQMNDAQFREFVRKAPLPTLES